MKVFKRIFVSGTVLIT